MACTNGTAVSALENEVSLPLHPPTLQPLAELALVLRHVGTERAWATGDVRTTTHSVAYTLDDWMDFKLDARSGLALMEVRGGAALVDTRSWTTARLLSDDEWLSVNLFPGTLALTDPEAMTIEVFDVRRANGSVELVSQHKFHVSTMTAVMALNTPSGAAAAVVSHAISAAEEGVRHKLSIHSAPDWDEGQLVDVEQYAVSALDDTNVSAQLIHSTDPTPAHALARG